MLKYRMRNLILNIFSPVKIKTSLILSEAIKPRATVQANFLTVIIVLKSIKIATLFALD